MYYSVTPYALGSSIVKYSAAPCDGADTSGAHADDPDYMRAALKSGLEGSDACFELRLQRGKSGMDVEDSTVTWSESESPFERVAEITIPAQEFDTPAQNKMCENLSFTPWHAPTSQRPLGAINRARKIVYTATSTVRHQLNGAARQEPTAVVPPQ